MTREVSEMDMVAEIGVETIYDRFLDCQQRWRQYLCQHPQECIEEDVNEMGLVEMLQQPVVEALLNQKELSSGVGALVTETQEIIGFFRQIFS